MTREREVKRACALLFQSVGCDTASFSENRASRIAPGWPDLFVWCRRKGTVWVMETKSPDGRQSDAQREMQERFEACNVPYLCGGLETARDYLRKARITP